MRFFLAVWMLCGVLGTPVAASAQTDHHPYTATDPFVRETPARISAGYLVLHNPTARPDRLIAVEAPWAGRTELHTIVQDKAGVLQMKHVPFFDIPANGTLSLAPGGDHMMFYAVATPLVANDRVPLRLIFKQAAPLDVMATVRPLTYRPAKTSSTGK